MWWARTEPGVQAWLGATRVAWWPHGAEAPSVAAASSLEDAIQRLLDWRGQASKRLRLAVLLDGDICQLRAVPAIAGAAGRDEAEAALSAQASDAVDAAREPATVRLAVWPMQGPLWLAVLVRHGVHEGLQAALGTALISVKPWWWRCMPVAASGGSAAAFDGRSLSYCDVDTGGRLLQAGTVSPMVDETSARRWLLRQAAGGGPHRQASFLRWGESGHGGSAPRTAGHGFDRWVQHVAQPEQ